MLIVLDNSWKLAVVNYQIGGFRVPLLVWAADIRYCGVKRSPVSSWLLRLESSQVYFYLIRKKPQGQFEPPETGWLTGSARQILTEFTVTYTFSDFFSVFIKLFTDHLAYLALRKIHLMQATGSFADFLPTASAASFVSCITLASVSFM